MSKLIEPDSITFEGLSEERAQLVTAIVDAQRAAIVNHIEAAAENVAVEPQVTYTPDYWRGIAVGKRSMARQLAAEIRVKGIASIVELS